MSLRGPPDIKKLEEKKKTKQLIKAIYYKGDTFEERRKIQFAAAEALSRISDPSTFEHLLPYLFRQLRDLDRGIEVDKIKNILINIGAPAVEPLQELYNKMYKAPRCSIVIVILGSIGDEWAVDTLKHALIKCWFPVARETAAVILGKPMFKNAATTALLISVADNQKKNISVRRAAVTSLTRYGNTQVFKAILDPSFHDEQGLDCIKKAVVEIG